MTVGLRETHDSALLHVTGQARYVDDIPAPEGCLHLAFGLSGIAKGRLASLDLAAVRAAPGVVDVLTAGDLARPADTSPSAHDEPLLCDSLIHFEGQPLFLVVATSHLAARKATRLAKVEVEAETPILTLDGALAADSRFEEGPRVWTKGDASSALASAPNRLSGRFEIGGQEHFYLEGQASLAIPGEGRWRSTPPPSTRPRSSTRSRMPSASPCTTCASSCAGWAAASAARRARAMRWPSPAPSRPSGPGAPAGCATTATTTWSSPASATTSTSTTRWASTQRGASLPST
ncbi:Xanthine dehydrogenase, molybdenum binding protein subunit [Rubellimicrobium mesophilum DSM 19309]|uniref:Xanthine dehydrogenase, molybdenum binding protein subunit n=1 Tax=Rubellimicrobium mesophilum DSM 19309 TaxID=442562 RepID=A0A017HKC3_9RHOB|nr:Xanthine dehydrogenase, molybdenum binding protein subunit [Rubellimicrobium mesophilum DSM 19309]